MLRIIHPNRWFIWTIAIIVAVFIVVWGAVERFNTEQAAYSTLTINQAPLRRETSQLDTVGWETYRNWQVGFEFKYPSDFLPQTVLIDSFVSVARKPAGFRDLETYVKDLAMKEEIEGNKTSATGLQVISTKIDLGNVQAFEKRSVASDAAGNTDAALYIEKNNQLIVFAYSYRASDINMASEHDDAESTREKAKYKTIQKVLSTFSFFEPTR